MLCSSCSPYYVATKFYPEEYPREWYCEKCGTYVMEYVKKSESTRRLA